MTSIAADPQSVGEKPAKIAVLIDAENASPSMASALLAEIAKYGTPFVKRAYGDWTGSLLNGWKERLLENSIQPIQQFSYTQGKNSSDAAMIIDAMDLLYTRRFDAFCLVTSDSDFTRLASRIRESGLVVYGFGERKTPQPLVTACDKFIYLDNLSLPVHVGGGASTLKDATAATNKDGAAATQRDVATAAAQEDAVATQRVHVASEGSAVTHKDAAAATHRDGAAAQGAAAKQPIPAPTFIKSAIKAVSDDDGWVNVARLGGLITKWQPDFDPRSFGFEKLSLLLNEYPFVETTQRFPAQGKPPVLYVRVRGRVNK
ncbi:hypothetical protein ISF_08848 [Cordyceps fumosorosea ARSEF 2679]|uniref:HTH OST-type domain-containing protein n=1 Tax=Cordyceps fumosorosea (strain ARSEF 2679) TaxID=1081104 RepID=A0A167LQB8_CORFA|nr:hypothetical protein ISF_08848 [Cordyceps fumosorosea ARSEF 2679]OAA53367.1 hypothetical protein ISF_08848 [Cordyceps fumosorosea ARSEF 2679]